MHLDGVAALACQVVDVDLEGTRLYKHKDTPGCRVGVADVHATLLEVVIWAAAFQAFGASASFEPAFYFSPVTDTTLGYGDITMNEEWRVLSSFATAKGGHNVWVDHGARHRVLRGHRSPWSGRTAETAARAFTRR